MTPPKKRRCQNPRCDGWFDEEIAFHHRQYRHGYNVYVVIDTICIGCRQTDRDIKKAADPWIAKVRSSIAHHAKKFELSAVAFCRQFGWTIDRLAYVLSHAYDNTCEYCYRSYKEMRNGLADITLDIVDPKQPPFFPTNVKPCCRTCNTEKGSMSPERWARRLIYYREWAEQQGRVPRQSDLFLHAAE
jgi:hypothetical protein